MNLFKRIKLYFPLIQPYFNITFWGWYPTSIVYMIERYRIPSGGIKRDSYFKQAINAAHFGYKYSIQLGFGKYAFFKTHQQAHIACILFKLYQLKLRYGNQIKLWTHCSGKKN
jgi:hypothetical protein